MPCRRLERVAATPTRIVLNGDTGDFLLNDDPLEMDVARAVSQAEASVFVPGKCLDAAIEIVYEIV